VLVSMLQYWGETHFFDLAIWRVDSDVEYFEYKLSTATVGELYSPFSRQIQLRWKSHEFYSVHTVFVGESTMQIENSTSDPDNEHPT